MLIIGHRGVGIGEAGVDMIEVDLRRNSSGEIVISHDKPRTSDLMTLVTLLATARVPLNLELKESGFEPEVLKAIKNFSSKVLISSKYPRILQKVRALDENIQLGLILGRANFFLLPVVSLLDRALNFYSVHPKTFLALKPVVAYLKRLNKKVFVWTVNDPQRFKQLKALNIDGVFTDYPNLIKN